VTRALLLDLDNTLVDRDVALRAWLDAALPAAARDPGTLDDLIACDAGGHGDRHAFFARFSAVAGMALGEVRRRFFRELPRLVRLKADADALLRRFVGPTVIVTNGLGTVQRAKIDAAGLGDRVDHIVVSGECGLRKPDPAIFGRALALIGCRPEQALMVGDHPAFDVDGARAAGIAAVLVRSRWFEVPTSMPSVQRLTDIAW
jgi:HAD superfamily hydrolase (TIGR01509 family)